MSAEINTHNLVCDFGRHKGELWTRIPVSYLRWLVNQPNCNEHTDIAAAELKRRGTVMPTIEISGHAIDSASLRCRKIWHLTAKDEHEGLHAWLCRMALCALTPDPTAETVVFAGIKWVFVHGEVYPTLKTVMPA
jgi:hypothetical protein